jgi:uncharacterized protein YodC (DUF2158 family)
MSGDNGKVIGSTVSLKSGSPPLTILALQRHRALCQWSAEDIVHVATFALEALPYAPILAGEDA